MSFETTETEEMITSLHIKVYHPQASVFKSLNFNEKQKYRAEESIKFGRDSRVCHFPLLDKRASRIQFEIQSFRHNDSSELCFEIKNISLKTRLNVNGAVLDHLNRIDLPKKCILQFSEFQFYLEKDDGEAREHFEIDLNLSLVPFCQEAIVETLSHPVAESGILNIPVTQCQFQSAVETDENVLVP
ncbi:TRAF-interacting protein with FHA domain-containing protein A [Pristis pectinata]|uniref:TRAF-interacting protein with FHA domain-containing protein A n=1 Tax=Pristis pectinata TaxID=685728 RepID=UPI00223E4CF8|nr:TRAF-interacting protein with FHA domain-containing protein A [Pristis pectinata]XP_051897749.1 TRAF-interacting protein with FHA domain-containing protein A [Pristis pectinata]XP_051897754.1 TRAF-interacting protein with FHA domain-containing protein A [Pristis pectinata]